MNDQGITLFSSSLFSKFGFYDGDTPEQVYEWLESDAPELLEDYGRTWRWRPVLVELVENHLLPWLGTDVETYRIETNHNPIRARSVNGVEVVDLEDDREEVINSLAVASVEVNKVIVLNTIRRHATNTKE